MSPKQMLSHCAQGRNLFGELPLYVVQYCIVLPRVRGLSSMPVRQKKLPLATQAGRSPVIGQPEYIDIGETACRPNIIEPGQPPSFITPPKLEISLREWLIIERRYDEKLEPKTRAQLQAASAKYLYNAKMEHAALPLTLANDTFADLLKSACNFLKRLAPVQWCATDTHTFIRARLQPKLRL